MGKSAKEKEATMEQIDPALGYYMATSPFHNDPEGKEAFHRKATRVIWGALTLLCLNFTLVFSLMAYALDQLAITATDNPLKAVGVATRGKLTNGLEEMPAIMQTLLGWSSLIVSVTTILSMGLRHFANKIEDSGPSSIQAKLAIELLSDSSPSKYGKGGFKILYLVPTLLFAMLAVTIDLYAYSSLENAKSKKFGCTLYAAVLATLSAGFAFLFNIMALSKVTDPDDVNMADAMA